jgi:hypothetical protein
LRGGEKERRKRRREEERKRGEDGSRSDILVLENGN